MSDFDLFNETMSKSLHSLFTDALGVSLRNPAQAVFMTRTIRAQKKAERRRLKNEKSGLHVPPFMIVSITHACNLQCKGCYAQSQHRAKMPEMDGEKLKNVIKEASELGIAIALLAGGEPFTKKEVILELASIHPEMIFPVFTNGMLINGELLLSLKKMRNLIPVLSIEGTAQDTDERRGLGVHSKISALFDDFKRNGIFYGVSITLTRDNFDFIMDPAYIKSLVGNGCKLFFFVDYVPVKEGTEHWMLTEAQRSSVTECTSLFRNTYPGLFIAFPGDESFFGGCLAAGRGFIHISPEGNVEPCPFAPFSDKSLKEVSLKESLGSELMKAIRDNHQLLTENQGGCALWENRELLQQISDNLDKK